MTSIAVVTPWKDHLELAGEYFEAVLPELEPGDENIIVDNGSEPPLGFASSFPGRNLGFCGGSNFGLHEAGADAVLFLNNDIVKEREGWLGEIRDLVEPGVLVGQLRDGRHADVDGRAIPYLDGWCLAGMRRDLLALGGFDQTLTEPAYYSDNLLCLEARVAGMTLRHVDVGLRHLENRTAGDQWNLVVRAASSDNQARYQARVREALAAV